MIRTTILALAIGAAVVAQAATAQSIAPPPGQTKSATTGTAAPVEATPTDAAAPTTEGALKLRATDIFRLDRLQDAKDEAASSVKNDLSYDEYDALLKRLALTGDPARTDPAAVLPGDWDCATTKIGELGLVSYDAFKCRITSQPDGTLLFEKLSGSQRVRGEIGTRKGQPVLAGVGYIAGDTPPDYADLPEVLDPAADPQRTADPGVVELLAQDHARILFPYPTLESQLDILELTR